MEIVLCNRKFDVSEINICEGRAKFLVREKNKDVYKIVKQKFLQCNSIAEMSQKISKIAGYLIMNTTKKLVYILHREGIKTNAKIFLDSVFQKYQSVCYKVSKIILQDYKSLGLKNKSDLAGAAEVFANAVVIDLNNLWYGYFFAHGFGRCMEFYTLQKFLDTEESLRKITFTTEKDIAIETYVNALKNIPYDMEIYNQAKILLGEDKNLDKYKSLFTQDFKKNSYQENFSNETKKTQSNITSKAVLFKTAYNKLRADIVKYQKNLTCNVYYYGPNEKCKKKFSGAMSSYAKLSEFEIPIICYDSTLFGSADEGFVLTTNGIHFKNMFQSKKFISWKATSNIELKDNKIFINDIEIMTFSPKKEIPILFEMIKEIRDKMIQYI